MKPRRKDTSKRKRETRRGVLKSGLERQVLDQLRKIKPKRSRISYESEKLPYHLIRSYIPDFVITRSDGSKLYVEVKGYLRPTDRTKMVAVKRLNPEADIRFVFAKDNILYKGASSRYSDWCVRNGFPYHIGLDIPRDWLK